jgi:hypothetical protein
MPERRVPIATGKRYAGKEQNDVREQCNLRAAGVERNSRCDGAPGHEEIRDVFVAEHGSAWEVRIGGRATVAPELGACMRDTMMPLIGIASEGL